MTIGEKLKRERKKLGYELDSVAQKTKIAKMFLIAIENDDLSSLPGGVYNRNFLRAYAKFLNLDEDIITAEYHEQYDVKPHFVVHQEQTKRDDGQYKKERSRFFLLIFLLLLIIGGGVAVYYYFPFWKKAPQESANRTAISASHPLIRPAQKTPVVTGARHQTNPAEPEKVTAESAEVPTFDHAEKETDSPGEAIAEDEQAISRDGVSEEATSVKEDVGSVVGGSVETSSLPFSSLEAIETYISEQGLAPSVFYGDADSMDQVFIIEAITPVQIEVYVDGTMATRRLLRPGQVRFYRAGNYNRVIIEDISRVNIQEGMTVFDGSGKEPRNVFLHDFETGDFLKRLEEIMGSGE